MLVRTVQWFVWKHSTFKFDGWSSVFLFKKYFKLPF
jgi:myosin-crossreactive antigen